MAEGVVDRLEVVEVDEQQREAAAGTVGDTGIDGSGQPFAVVQSGQRVVGSLMLQLSDVPPTLGDIPLHTPDAAEVAVLDGTEERAAQPDELSSAVAIRRFGLGDVIAEADEAGSDPTEVALPV